MLFKNGYSLLANSHFSPFKDEDGVRYRSVEHYIHAQKALRYNDYLVYQEILAERSARKIKDIPVDGYSYADWSAVVFEVMKKGLMLKFTSCAEAKEKLVLTGDAKIIFATPYDNVFGNGLPFEADDSTEEKKWKGWNTLGRLLEEIRQIITTQQ